MDLSGWDIESAIVREFWLNGQRQGDCATFLRNPAGSVAMVFLDHEDYTWKVRESVEDPGPTDLLGDSSFQYPHRDFGRQHGIIGSTITAWTEYDAGDRSVAHLHLSDGRVVVLEYSYKAEKTVLSVRSGNSV